MRHIDKIRDKRYAEIKLLDRLMMVCMIHGVRYSTKMVVSGWKMT